MSHKHSGERQLQMASESADFSPRKCRNCRAAQKPALQIAMLLLVLIAFSLPVEGSSNWFSPLLKGAVSWGLRISSRQQPPPSLPLNKGEEIIGGTLVTKTPQRIVSLAPACTEIVAGLGLQKKLVGITEHTDYPTDVLNLPVVGSYVNLNLEAIVSLKPDLVVATDDGNPEQILERLKELSIPVFVMNLRTYERIQESILALGKILHAESEAKAQAGIMSRVANCIRERTENAGRPKVLFVYESYPFVTAGAGTFTDQLIQMAGAESITQDVKISYPRLTIENVLAKNPDVVIESSMDFTKDKESKLDWWNQWPMLEAVRKKRIHVLESKNLDRPSQRVVYGFLQLAKALHPDLFTDGACAIQ